MPYSLPANSPQLQPPFFTQTDQTIMSGSYHQFNSTSNSVGFDEMMHIDPALRSHSQQVSQQQRPIQRFMGENQRLFFTAPPAVQAQLPYHLHTPSGLSREIVPIGSHPQTSRGRMDSPVSSQDPTTASNAHTPGADFEFNDSQHHSPPQDDFAFPHNAFDFSQGLPESWNYSQENYSYPAQPLGGYSDGLVSMSQIQGIADHQESSFVPEDSQGSFNQDLISNQYGLEADDAGTTIEVDASHASFRYHDEGIGPSIKDEASPYETGSNYPDLENDNTSMVDADGEDDFEEIPSDPVSDTEYHPRSTRGTRTRRAAKSATPPKKNRISNSRVAKPSSKPKNGQSICNACPPSENKFKDTVALQRHFKAVHNRSFSCIFDFAGCTSAFANKNEWKRHTATQHINFESWVCKFGACIKSHNGKGMEFNRKDLFTQHLRRMHAPPGVGKTDTKNAKWEAALKNYQFDCLRINRQKPTQLACPMGNCNVRFDGPTCWDDKMEHVGRHLVKAGQGNEAAVQQANDGMLVRWALSEKIIEHKTGGGYRLCRMSVVDTAAACGVEDEDAEGEDE